MRRRRSFKSSTRYDRSDSSMRFRMSSAFNSNRASLAVANAKAPRSFCTTARIFASSLA